MLSDLVRHCCPHHWCSSSALLVLTIRTIGAGASHVDKTWTLSLLNNVTTICFYDKNNYEKSRIRKLLCKFAVES